MTKMTSPKIGRAIASAINKILVYFWTGGHPSLQIEKAVSKQ
jgi:hypothetical protein